MVKEENEKRTDIQEILREKMAKGIDPIDALNEMEKDDSVDKEALGRWADNFNRYRERKSKSR